VEVCAVARERLVLSYPRMDGQSGRERVHRRSPARPAPRCARLGRGSGARLCGRETPRPAISKAADGRRSPRRTWRCRVGEGRAGTCGWASHVPSTRNASGRRS
jgi:hypothetical protein